MIKIFLVVQWPVGGIRTFVNYGYANSNWGAPEIQLLNNDEVLKNKYAMAGYNYAIELQGSDMKIGLLR